MVIEIRDICEKFSDEDVRANVFNNYFLYTDQYLTIFSQSLQTILLTGVSYDDEIRKALCMGLSS